MKTEDHIIELESRLAFQEHSINELNDVITRQQGQIDTLMASVQVLNNKLKEMADTGASSITVDEKPPHY
ncbi:MAG: SlyX family protein [Gammaproteobacteria bacterium]|nr:SlyX family protein [Gammaproteobacteria bacterium]